MVRPLIGLVVGVVFLAMIGTAFGQGVYDGSYPGTYQYGGSPQAYGNQAYGNQAYGNQAYGNQAYGNQAYGNQAYGQQGAYPGYGQQYPGGYTQNQQGAAPTQAYQSYPGYADYTNALQQSYGAGAPSESYQGYGTPGGVYQPQTRYAPVQRRQRRRAAVSQQTTRVPRERATRSQDTAFSNEVEEDTLVAKEIYWDPNAESESSESDSVQAPRETRPTPVLESQTRSSRPAVERTRRTRPTPSVRASSTLPSPPASSKSLTWGRNKKEMPVATAKRKPESRRSFSWGKKSKPAMVTSEPGSATVRSDASTTVGQQVKVEERVPTKKFQWGKAN